ncbi:cyclic nucleotide-binding domain-containing protein [Catenovulum sediminis]|uniref:Cyclic nucleotide-binding domain-containing protein n=1 Tax=Catenovulum sediminis TaxID=1740262 RepID=A0ABV1RM22_9ALTE
MKKIEKINALTELEIFSRIPIFQSLSASERSCFLTDDVVFFIVEKDEYVIRQNDNDHYFYILLSGHLEVTKNANNALIAYIEPGQFVGEIGFITNQPRTAHVKALEKSVVIQIDHNIMNRLPIKVRDQLKDQIITGLVERISHLNDELIESHEIQNKADKTNEGSSKAVIQLADDWENTDKTG